MFEPAQGITIDMIIFLLSAFPISVVSVLLLHEYQRKKYNHLLYMGIAWIFSTLWLVVQAASFLFLSNFLYIVSVLFIIPMAFFHVFALDFMTREKTDLKKIFIITILSTLFAVSCITNQSVKRIEFENGNINLSWDGGMALYGSILSLLTGLFIFYYSVKIYINSPRNVKMYSFLYSIGGCLIGIVTPIIGMFNFHWDIPGVPMPIFTLGIIICAIALLKKPQIAYITPFKALRLSIIHTQSGLSLYTHHWTKTSNSDTDARFTGMMHGISTILNHSLGKGDIKEIQLEKASLLLQRSPDLPVVCVLIATKTSQSLRDGLKNFSTNFFKQFAPHIQNSTELDPFKEVVTLVEHCFPFIPEY